MAEPMSPTGPDLAGADPPGSVPGAPLVDVVGRQRSVGGRRPPSSTRPSGRTGSDRGDIRSRTSRAAGRVRGGAERERPRTKGSGPASRWTPTDDELDLLASLLEAGLPLVEALSTLETMAVDAPARAAVMHLEARVRSGYGLAATLDELAAPAHVRMLVDSGERTGRLVLALRRAALLTRRLEVLRSEARRALVYPSLVLAIGAGILAVIAIAVVPPLERTFIELGGELPRATRIVLAASAAISAPATWASVALALAVIIAGRRWPLLSVRIPVLCRASRTALAESVSRRSRSTPGIGRVIDRITEHLPLWGPIRRGLRLTIISHVMGALIDGGVPLDSALAHVSETIGPARVAQVMREAAIATQQGLSPFVPEQLGRLLDSAEIAMLRVGERNGLAAEQWSRIAERRDRDLEGRIRRTGVIIEPILIAIVGAVVGGAVLALYLPTFRVVELL
jgi:type II secretory pathway component PulF